MSASITTPTRGAVLTQPRENVQYEPASVCGPANCTGKISLGVVEITRPAPILLRLLIRAPGNWSGKLEPCALPAIARFPLRLHRVKEHNAVFKLVRRLASGLSALVESFQEAASGLSNGLNPFRRFIFHASKHGEERVGKTRISRGETRNV